MKNIGDTFFVYLQPFEALSNLLLAPIVKGTHCSLNVGDLEPGCLPIRIGSAWGKIIEEFSHLESQMIFLKKMLRLQDSVFESLRSLDSFMAVSLNRYPDALPDTMNLTLLLDAFKQLIAETLDKAQPQ
jgi:hypothetical protein